MGTQKDFGPIADDYAFFETHATEAEEDARAYASHLAGVTPTGGAVRVLDFGCGSGAFTERFLEQARWPRERLRLALVEPVEAARRQAAGRLDQFTDVPVADWPALPDDRVACFDVVLSNHALYYVTDIGEQVSRLITGLAPSGLLLTAIAGRENALIEFWIKGFGLLGRPIPYYTAEDLEAALKQLGVHYQKERVPYELVFPDTVENRMKILRFLLSDHLAELPHGPLLELFDRHVRSGRVEIRTASDHFIVPPGRDAPG